MHCNANGLRRLQVYFKYSLSLRSYTNRSVKMSNLQWPLIISESYDRNCLHTWSTPPNTLWVHICLHPYKRCVELASRLPVKLLAKTFYAKPTTHTHTHTERERERETGAHENDVQGSIKGHTTLKAGDDGVCLQGEGPLWACPGFESFLTVVNHHPPTGASWWWVYKTHWHLWPETDLPFKLTCSAFLKRPPYKHQAEPAT